MTSKTTGTDIFAPTLQSALPTSSPGTESDSKGQLNLETVPAVSLLFSSTSPTSGTIRDNNFTNNLNNENSNEIKRKCPNCHSDTNCYSCNCENRSLLSLNADSTALETPPKPTPFTYQIQGAIQAVYHGKTLIADEPGLGKTLQALLCIQLLKVERTLIICPPTLIANWQRETNLNIPTQTTHTITPKTKNPQPPKTAITITSDTLLTARPQLQTTLKSWQPELIIIDEAHRLKNTKAQRTKMALKLTRNTPHTILLTGTPIISTPLDILPLLHILNKTHHFPPNFVNYYTTENYWGGREPITEKLPDLHQRLQAFVWTRRTKADVLTQLPSKTRNTQWITLANKDLEKITGTIEKSLTKALKKGKTIEDWITDARQQVSGLRKATGLAKLPAALDWITSHWDGTHRPLLVWAHHTEVIETLEQQLNETLGFQFRKGEKARIAKIYGPTPQAERQKIVDKFQNGEIDILILQIVAAGVGLTLTRASDALFVETDWTPANNVQAEDRIHRISQTQPVTITTLIADKTLDPVVHRILQENISVLDRLTPGSDHHVTAATGGTDRVSRILAEYAKEILEREETLW